MDFRTNRACTHAWHGPWCSVFEVSNIIKFSNISSSSHGNTQMEITSYCARIRGEVTTKIFLSNNKFYLQITRGLSALTPVLRGLLYGSVKINLSTV